jgi:hypothetical protein
MIPTDTLTLAKERLDVAAVWQMLALPGVPARSCRCPWHEDRNASFSIFAGGNRWKCFKGCGHGDAISFLQCALKLSTGTALREFVRLAGLDPARPRPLAALVPVRLKLRPDAPQPAPEWPPMHAGTPTDHERLAAVRRVSVASVALAAHRGLLTFGRWRDLPAWFVRDRSHRVAQARRLDGARWWPDGPKALTLPGGCASWPVGLLETDGFPVIALCEGGPDMLAALHLALSFGREADIAPVGMLGAGQRIHADALPLFAGRRVRIFAHADEDGRKGAILWTRQLREAGARVDALDLTPFRTVAGANLKDLNDLATHENHNRPKLLP